MSSQNQAWAESSGVGKRLLQSMGWKEGQGLGKEGQGRAAAVKLAKRADMEAGLGFDGTKEQAAPVVGDSGATLSSILSQLKQTHDDGITEQQQQEEQEETTIQTSTRRKRYRKMHEAKDVSKYSAKELDAIFGRASKQE